VTSITPAQIKKLHALKRALGLDEDAYRAALGSMGVESSKDLSLRQAGVLIDRLEDQAIAAGRWKPCGRRRHQDLQGKRGRSLGGECAPVIYATPDQIRMIEGMWEQVSRATDADSRLLALNRFCARIVKIDNPRWLERHHVPKIVAAMKRMGAEKL